MLEYLAVRAPLAAPDCYQGYARFLGGLDAGVDVGVPDAQFDIRPGRRAFVQEEVQQKAVGHCLHP